MRHLLLLLLLWLFAVAPAMATTEFQSQDEFSQWVTYYYKNPSPNRIPEAVAYMSKSGLLDNKKAIAPLFGFLSGAFRDNPDMMAVWVKQLNSIKVQNLDVVVLGVWYAALPDSQKTVYALLEKHPNLKAKFSYLYRGEPITVEQIPLEQGGWVLDALWGKFMATGGKEPVKRIISVLPWIDIKGDINRLLVGGAANWSLTSNAIQHKRILEICETEAKTQNGEVAAKLRHVIGEAKKDLKVAQPQ